MIRTTFTELLGIEAPIMCAPFGPWDEVELAAAVCGAGGLGSLGTAVRSTSELCEQWRRLRDRTDRPFAVNHTMRPFDEDAFAATLDAAPAAVSFHMGVPTDLIARAHDRGILWIQQVTTASEARAAVDAGADVLVAQGGEAGGHCGEVGTTVLVRQVVRIAPDRPVLAAGGVADGWGLAAMLVLGAAGVNMGTRFLASSEMAVSAAWKERIVRADATDAVKVHHTDRIMPPYTRPGPSTAPRALRTELVDRLNDDPAGVDPATTIPAFIGAVRNGAGDEYLPFSGQSAGLVEEVLPAATIVARTVGEAESALAAAAAAVVGVTV